MGIGNSLMVIHPFDDQGSWVFTDSSVGLVKEPFVFGMPEIIEAALFEKGIPLEEAQRGFDLIFSSNPFPKHQVVLTWVKEECGGNWYRNEKAGQDEQIGWLCPALFKYFPVAPPKIYASCSLPRSNKYDPELGF